MPRSLLVLSLLLLPRLILAGEFRLPLLPAAPTLDGRLDAAEWDGAARFDGLVWNDQLERRRAQAWVGATATQLCLAVRSQLPDQGGIQAQIDRDTLKLVYDDAVEFWVDPTPGSDHGRSYQLLANALGHHAYDNHPRGNAPAQPDWEGHWQLATKAENGWWVVEALVPIAEIAPGRKATDGSWGINICRDWKPDWAWSCLSGGAYAPANRFTFAADAPVVAQHERGNPLAGELDQVLVISNPGAQPITVQAELLLTRDVMPEAKESRTLVVPPHGRETLPLKLTDASTNRFDLTAKVTAGAVTLYERHYGWKRSAPWQWITTKQEAPPVDVQFAYYPYLNRMKVRLDVTNLPGDAQLDRAVATIREKGGKAIKAVPFAAFEKGKQTQTFELPPLKGSYELAVALQGKNLPAGELVKPFERTRYEWEQTTLGRSHKVYPPFEPLRYQNSTLSCVGRDYALGADGLCRQITAAGKPLLAGEIQLALRTAGQPANAATGTLAADAGGIAEDRVAYHGTVQSAGGPALTYRAEWAEDGCLRYDLTLPATGGKEIESLDLLIPLRNDAAPLLHAMGDSIRNTLYEKVPVGEGVVWTAEKTRSEDLPRKFCSYIYLGGPNRGLCWFAENDKGWSWDRAKPNLDIVRQGDTLTLRVHLIDHPTVIAAPRTITFGLQAAPVKPKLSPWRYRWLRENYSLLGTDINWLALGDCGSVYPAEKDLALWEAIKKGNTTHMTDAEIEAVYQKSVGYNQPYGQDRVNAWKAHVYYNLRSRYGAKMVFYYNRASFQKADEFQTFQDEWALSDWRTVGPGKGIGEIKIVPSDSYIDHAVWWYAKSFDVGGNQGVYWDNWFFAGSYNTQMTQAYVQPDGAVSPATGVWGLRELCRRTFQMMNEKGLLPITMPHMTSTNILPMHGFATVQYDWEWKYSEGDVQYRFPREYLLLVSNGELAGTWPVLLGDHGKLESDPWTQRTFAAVSLVHELNGPVMPSVSDKLYKPVWEYLDQPGVEAWRYWDERPQPVVADNPDLPTIVYSLKGKSALFAVTSYVDGDATCNLTIDAAALGLGTYRVRDAETNEVLPVKDGKLSFPLKKHDVRLCYVEVQR